MSSTTAKTYQDETVVLVPGIYAPRITMLPMAWRLQKHGFKTRIFSNRYLLKTPTQNGQRLQKFITRLNAGTVHLVGHSLGGVVIMHTLKCNAETAAATRFSTGRVVLIASPIRGNAFAQQLNNYRWLRWILGRSIKDGVLQASPTERDGRQIGIISCSVRGGLGALVYKPTETNDGLVLQSETVLDGAKDSVCIPQSHSIVLFSKLGNELTASFLRHGDFKAGAALPPR